MEDLKDKVVLVTGGSSGIGRAAALAFARRGARVAIAARGVDRGTQVLRELETAGATAIFVPADVSRAEQVKALLEKTVETFGRLDCAFNNAAALEEPLVMTADFTEEQFDRSIALNLKSVWLCMQQEIRQMLRQEPPGGAIVNTTSVNGLGGTPRGAVKQGIRVNVAGPFRTPLLASVIDRISGGDAAARETIEKQWAGMLAMGRIGNPEEAAEAVVCLCSKGASYVTGHSMIVDGGMTAAMR